MKTVWRYKNVEATGKPMDGYENKFYDARFDFGMEQVQVNDNVAVEHIEVELTF